MYNHDICVVTTCTESQLWYNLGRTSNRSAMVVFVSKLQKVSLNTATTVLRSRWLIIGMFDTGAVGDCTGEVDGQVWESNV